MSDLANRTFKKKLTMSLKKMKKIVIQIQQQTPIQMQTSKKICQELLP